MIGTLGDAECWNNISIVVVRLLELEASEETA
jgi:hypothetical protein